MAVALRVAAGVAWLTCLAVLPVAAQSVAAEVDVSAGVSTENVRAAASQARLFGATPSDWRFLAEVSLGGAWGHQTDAFSSAYPYDRKLRAIEAYAEKMFHPSKGLVAVRGGRYRSPFGIYGRSDHAYTGFTRAPLIRYGEAFALSNTFLTTGGDVLVGTPRVYGEVSVGIPQDEGQIRRRRELDVVVRVQAYYKSFIIGASRMHTGRDRALGNFAKGSMVFNGIDGRWMSGGVQLRGEWIFGRPFTGVFTPVSTSGGYLDAIVHRLGMGPVTAVARVEKLDYPAGDFSFYYRRVTAGARVRLGEFLSGQINILHQPSGLAASRTTALDVGLTCTIRR